MDVIDIGLDDPNITRAGECPVFILVSWRDIVGCGWVRSLYADIYYCLYPCIGGRMLRMSVART